MQCEREVSRLAASLRGVQSINRRAHSKRGCVSRTIRLVQRDREEKSSFGVPLLRQCGVTPSHWLLAGRSERRTPGVKRPIPGRQLRGGLRLARRTRTSFERAPSNNFHDPAAALVETTTESAQHTTRSWPANTPSARRSRSCASICASRVRAARRLGTSLLSFLPARTASLHARRELRPEATTWRECARDENALRRIGG